VQIDEQELVNATNVTVEPREPEKQDEKGAQYLTLDELHYLTPAERDLRPLKCAENIVRIFMGRAFDIFFQTGCIRTG
jgi:hypothetical protein